MANTKKLIQAAAGVGGGDAVYVDDLFSVDLWDGTDNKIVVDNGINLGQSYGSGSVLFRDGKIGTGNSNPAGLDFGSSSELAMGDFTIEGFVWIVEGSSVMPFVSIGPYDTGVDVRIGITDNQGVMSYVLNSSAVGGGTLNKAAWNHVAVVRTGTSLYSYINGSRVATHTVSSTTLTAAASSIGGIVSGATYNGWRYMSNVRVSNTARYTGTSLTVPTAEFTSDANTIVLACQGATPLVDNSSYGRTLTPDESNTGLVEASVFGPFSASEAGDGGAVYQMKRSTSEFSGFYDTENGIQNGGVPEETYSYGTASYLENFNKSGYIFSSSRSDDGLDYMAYTWKKHEKFFDIQKYTGNGTTGKSISHNLNATPAMVVIKKTDAAGQWYVYHKDIGTGSYLNWDTNSGTTSNSSYFVSASSTDFVLGSNGSVNGNGQQHVAYFFANNDGDGIFGEDGDEDVIKVGSFTTDSYGKANIDLGFMPQFIMVKTTGTSNWWLLDTKRGLGGDDVVHPHMLIDTSGGESSFGADYYILTGKGFRVNEYLGNTTYVYMAIRDDTHRPPETGKDVFHNIERTEDPTFTKFDADLIMTTDSVGDANSANYPKMTTRLLGNSQSGSPSGQILNASSNAAATTTTTDFIYSRFGDARSISGPTNARYDPYIFKRAKGFMDIIPFSFRDTDYPYVDHGLGVVPELIIMKAVNATGDWCVMPNVSPYDYRYRVFLHSNDAVSGPSTNFWANTAPTSTQFRVDRSFAGGNSNITSSTRMISYLFATKAGVSKVGVYTGNGGTLNVDCGFENGARLVILKRMDSSGHWTIYSTQRGINTGDEPLAWISNNTQHYFGNDQIDPYSSGFAVNNQAGPIYSDNFNVNNGKYLFLAIA